MIWPWRLWVKIDRHHVGEAGCETRVPDSSKRLITNALFAKRGLLTKHVRTKTILLLAKTRIARTYYLDLISFYRKYTILNFTNFCSKKCENLLIKPWQCPFKKKYWCFFKCSNYAKRYTSIIRQDLGAIEIDIENQSMQWILIDQYL